MTNLMSEKNYILTRQFNVQLLIHLQSNITLSNWKYALNFAQHLYMYSLYNKISCHREAVWCFILFN